MRENQVSSGGVGINDAFASVGATAALFSSETKYNKIIKTPYRSRSMTRQAASTKPPLATEELDLNESYHAFRDTATNMTIQECRDVILSFGETSGALNSIEGLKQVFIDAHYGLEDTLINMCVENAQTVGLVVKTTLEQRCDVAAAELIGDLNELQRRSAYSEEQGFSATALSTFECWSGGALRLLILLQAFRLVEDQYPNAATRNYKESIFHALANLPRLPDDVAELRNWLHTWSNAIRLYHCEVVAIRQTLILGQVPEHQRESVRTALSDIINKRADGGGEMVDVVTFEQMADVLRDGESITQYFPEDARETAAAARFASGPTAWKPSVRGLSSVKES